MKEAECDKSADDVRSWLKTLVESYIERALEQSEFPPALSVLKSGLELRGTSSAPVVGQTVGPDFCVAGPFCSTSRDSNSLSGFKRVSGYYLSEKNAYELEKTFHVFQAGSSSLIHSNNFDLNASGASELRRSIRWAQRQKLVFSELPIKSVVADDVKKLESRWLSRHRGPKIRFLLNGVKYPSLTSDKERWFGVEIQGKLSAFVSAIPYGGGYYFEHMIFEPHGPRMALEYVMIRALDSLFNEGVREVSLGFNPYDIPNPKSALEKVLSEMSKSAWPYNSKGILSFKKKFLTKEVPRFLYLEKRRSITRQLMNLIGVTYDFKSLTPQWEAAPLGKEALPFQSQFR